ncbi:CRISPR-associated helicase Cas3' (plasmid) [Nocardia sp. CWNU-33]|uniref:CRISPR-associated helicase Cas3' n=1 Tax=Nocardia sp. CWNU-33 TaxID=3392117 RepID=UPI00398E75A9
MLSASTLSAWAKTDRDGGSLSLVRHLADSAAVAGYVWDRWLPASTKRAISAELPRGVEDGRVLLRWLAGVHDIGKLTPAFACQVGSLAEVMHDKGLTMRSAPANRKALPHGLAGQVEVERFLIERGWGRKVAKTYSIVVGSHHGKPPTLAESHDAPRQRVLLGTDAEWARCRDELLTHVTVSVGAEERLDEWRYVPLSMTVQVLLTAAVIVSDWIASNQDLFPLDSARLSDTAAGVAWDELGLAGPWTPSVTVPDEGLFRARFDLPEHAIIRPLQAECVSLAARVLEPGLMIIEAPMGEGKTEAALLAAEILARRFGFGGVFVALPTMATSNAMFDRVREWADRLTDSPSSMFLAHGKAALNPSFVELKHKGFASIGADCDDDGVTAHSWYVGKKGPLANIVVGTIDQILRGALKARHVMLRHLALANKVVVIDEVHAADSYMSTYLCRCLEWLGAYHVPVLLLSATLPPAQRVSLIEAYQRGRLGGAVEALVAPPQGYPSISVWPLEGTSIGVPASGRSIEVHIEKISDDIAEVVATVRKTVAAGGVVGIVCNTVARAQTVFGALVDDEGLAADQLLLLHSRFVASQRTVLENQLRTLLGPPEKATRPTGGFVVVGTQVIEQSLDIDVDLLITDLAPIDLMLQRIGRLHRHARDNRPDGVTSARCLIRGADWSSTAPIPDKGSAAVYESARLLRAAAVIDTQPRAVIAVPDDVPTLVEQAYAEPFATPRGWTDVMDTAEDRWRTFTTKQQERARTYLLPRPYGEESTLCGWLTAGVPDDVRGVGGQAQVRDAEDTIEAIVVRQVGGAVYALSEVPDYGGRLIPIEGPPESGFAKALAACTIRLPASLTNYGRMEKVINALEATYYPGWQQSPWLAGELVLALDEENSAVVAGYRLRYDERFGLLINQIESER